MRFARFSVLIVFAFVLLACGLIRKPAAQQEKPILKATFKVAGKPDQEIVMKQLPPKTTRIEIDADQFARAKVIADDFRKAYKAPKNTPADHCLLVPHQVLDPDAPAAAVKTHSVLTKSKVATATCTREQHDSGTYTGNGNSATRFLPSFGGRFGGGGRFGF